MSGSTARNQCHETKPSGITSSLSANKQCWDFLKLGKQPAVGDGLLPNTCDVETLGSTTILRRHERRNGHWRRRAHVTVLAKLFWDLGQQYTAQ